MAVAAVAVEEEEEQTMMPLQTSEETQAESLAATLASLQEDPAFRREINRGVP